MSQTRKRQTVRPLLGGKRRHKKEQNKRKVKTRSNKKRFRKKTFKYGGALGDEARRDLAGARLRFVEGSVHHSVDNEDSKWFLGKVKSFDAAIRRFMASPAFHEKGGKKAVNDAIKLMNDTIHAKFPTEPF